MNCKSFWHVSGDQQCAKEVVPQAQEEAHEEDGHQLGERQQGLRQGEFSHVPQTQRRHRVLLLLRALQKEVEYRPSVPRGLQQGRAAQA